MKSLETIMLEFDKLPQDKKIGILWSALGMASIAVDKESRDQHIAWAMGYSSDDGINYVK